MHIKVDKKNDYEVIEPKGFWERFKILKFDFEKLNYVVRFRNRKFATTAFLCQRIDIIMTDEDEKILYIYEDVKSEKYFLPKFRVKNVYFFPLDSARNFAVGETLILRKDKKEG